MIVDNKKELIIFSDYNQRGLIALIRTLEKNDVCYSIISVGDHDFIYSTSYFNRVVCARQLRELDLEDILRCIKLVRDIKLSKEYIIIPSTEALNRFILRHRLKLEELNCIVPLVDENIYELISNKESFVRLCRNNNIITPSEYPLDYIIYPCVAKPKNYTCQVTKQYIKPVILRTENEFDIFCNNYIKESFFFQEYVLGESYYLLYYFSNSADVYSYSQKNLIQQSGGKSIIAAESASLHNTDISIKYENLFRKINFVGLIMVELKKYSGEYYMIESNPRLWGPSQLFVDANCNLFERLLEDFGLIAAKKIYPFKESKYFWHGGMVSTLSSNERVVYHDFTEELFFEWFDIWLQSDVYKRPDSMKHYNREIQNVEHKHKT